MIAISTAFSNALIALDVKGKQDFLELDASAKNSEQILPAIDQLLSKNNLEIKDNDLFGVVVGPGSFTGLRIGIAIIKGLCAGLRLPAQVVPISSLDLMAQEYLKEKPEKDFLCVINALSGLCFVCEYDINGVKIGRERMITKEELDIIELVKIGLENENLVEKSVKLSPQCLLDYALNKAEKGDFVDFRVVAPVYLRKSQAEAQLEEKNLKKS